MMAMSTGLLPLCALTAAYIVAVRKLSRTDRHLLIFAILIIASAHLMVESSQLYISFGVGIIFLSSAFAPESDSNQTVTRQPPGFRLKRPVDFIP